MLGNSKKQDRSVVNITIEFNLTAIGKWLKDSGRFEDIATLEKDWRDVAIRKYDIDILPLGNESDAYFHRKKGVFSQNIAGVDFLDNIDDETKNIIKTKADIDMLSWEMWQGSLMLVVGKEGERGLIFLSPILTEVLELYKTGGIKKHEKESDDLRKQVTEEVELEIPYSFDDNKNPKEFTKVWRMRDFRSGVEYYNALGRVLFFIPDRETLY